MKSDAPIGRYCSTTQLLSQPLLDEADVDVIFESAGVRFHDGFGNVVLTDGSRMRLSTALLALVPRDVPVDLEKLEWDSGPLATPIVRVMNVVARLQKAGLATEEDEAAYKEVLAIDGDVVTRNNALTYSPFQKSGEGSRFRFG